MLSSNVEQFYSDMPVLGLFNYREFLLVYFEKRYYTHKKTFVELFLNRNNLEILRVAKFFKLFSGFETKAQMLS
jgi:hypothetical protein